MKATTFFRKRFQFIALLIGILFINIYEGFSQTSICEPCPQLAEYIDSPNRADKFIKAIGYEPPTHLKSAWKKFPAIRKIEMAYEAYQNKGNGKKFLSKLSNSIQKNNGAIGYETKLKSILDLNYEGDLSYNHSTIYQEVNLPQPIRSQIMTISKYTEAGAFGGVRGVLQYKLGLPEDEVYKILRESTSFTDAFERGLNQAKIPPSQQARITNLTKDLMKKYPSATYDEALKDFLKKNNVEPNIFDPGRNRVTNSITKAKLKKPTAIKTNVKTKKYNVFISKYYPEKNNRLFSKMIKTPRGHGGVIFGNTITDETNLPNMESIRFIPTDTILENRLIGNLEFIFENGTEFVEYGVYEEDVYAANELVFKNSTQGYIENEGIGLASIQGSAFNYFESEIPYGVLLHPVIVNLELGWAALMADALPISLAEMNNSLNKVEIKTKDSILIAKALDSATGRYKIVDIPIRIKVEENRLELYRSDMPDSLIIEDVFITMQSFKEIWDDDNNEPEIVSFENKDFYNAIPILTNSIDEYKRINQFAKIFALFRWAKSKEVKAEKNKIPEVGINFLVESPELIFITTEGNIKYNSLEDNHLKYKEARLKLIKLLENNLKLYEENYDKVVFDKINEDFSTLWEYLLTNDPFNPNSVKTVYENIIFNLELALLNMRVINDYFLRRFYQKTILMIVGELVIIGDMMGIES
jgi:uncharacterized protein YozE (UPF0346 family)